MPKEIEYAIAGYKKFREKYFEGNNHLYEELKTGQKPKIMVIACADSRVDPAIILNCQPGDLFVVRNVANLVPPYQTTNGHHGTSAALEFAILGLKIKHIVILGHSNCGGIRALVDNADSVQKRDFISDWMEIAKPALKQVNEKHPDLSNEEKASKCSKSSLVNSLSNLLTFPWIKERVEKQELFLRSWHFDINSGIIEEFDQNLQEFKQLQIDS